MSISRSLAETSRAPAVIASQFRFVSNRGHDTAARRSAFDDTILLPLDRLRPTQCAVGMRSVSAKRAKVESRIRKAARIESFLSRRPIPAVAGPGDAFYMIDHHHLGLALWQAEVRNAFVHVIEDLSGVPSERFWRLMEAAGRLYPFDEGGRRVEPRHLPRSLAALRGDPYRDLAWSVRCDGGFRKTSMPYSEFQWADYFRPRISEALLYSDYDAALRKALKLARRREAEPLPGYRRR